MGIFTDILAHEEVSRYPPEDESTKAFPAESEILATVAKRLLTAPDGTQQLSSSPQDLASRLKLRYLAKSVEEEQGSSPSQDSRLKNSLSGRILLRLEEIMADVLPGNSSGIGFVETESGARLRIAGSSYQPSLSIGILSQPEWKTLLRSFVSRSTQFRTS